MTKEKLISLEKYLAKQQDLLKNPPTPSQATKEYKFFLEKDIKSTTANIEEAKVAGVTAK